METLTEAISVFEKGRADSEMRGHRVQYFSEKSAFAEKIQELDSPSRAPARSSAQGRTDLTVGFGKIIQYLKGPS